MKIRFSEPSEPRSGAVVVGVWEDGTLTPAARKLDEATAGAVRRALAAAPRFKGKKDEWLPIIGPPQLALTRILLAGLGAPGSLDARRLRELGGGLVAQLNAAGESEATLLIEPGAESPIGEAEAAAELAFGARLRAYRFDKYRTKEKPEKKPSLQRLTVASASVAAAQRAHRPLEKVAEAVAFARDLVSEPANVIYPETLAEAARELTELGVKVEVLDEAAMRRLGMNALLAVGQGSGPLRAAAPRPPHRSLSSARALPSIPAASRSNRRPAWRK
jgi:leucyl aminopeptidase